MSRIILTIVVMIVLVMAIGLIYMYSGAYNVSATEEHNSLTLWMLNNTTDYSIEHQSVDIKPPDNLDDSDMIARGFEHYDEMCVKCHGAPGISADEFAEGLYPKAPDLAEHVKDWNPSELFWITKNGIKMTGMPAFASTHTDDDIWAITSFLEVLPGLGYRDYLNMREAQEASGESHVEEEHHH
jgi:mono/diheme cytochrome c family protein